MSEQTEKWCPDVCPITQRPFFLWIEHWQSGQMVPTYGGPFDSYTIPEKDAYGDYTCERYDHDRGGWLVDECENVGVQIVDSQLYTSEDDPKELQAERDALASIVKQMREALGIYADEWNQHWERGMPILEPISDAALALDISQAEAILRQRDAEVLRRAAGKFAHSVAFELRRMADAYRDNWDAIFGKKEPVSDADSNASGVQEDKKAIHEAG